MRLGPAVRPAVFGSYDGASSVLGVLLPLAGQPRVLVVSALGLAVAGGVSMAGGEWLSDSRNGIGPSLVIGAATFGGTILPALPYAITSGPVAAACSALLILALGAVIALVRSRDRKKLRAFTETFGLLSIAAAAVYGCVALTGGAG